MGARGVGVPPMKVLIVDDDEVTSAQLARGFRARQCLVTVAHTSRDALRVARADVPSLAVVDLILGNDSGIDLIEPLHRLSPAIRIVVLSGRHDTPLIVESVRRGAVSYLTKPRCAEDILREAAVDRETKVDPRGPLATRKQNDISYVFNVLELTGWNISRAAEVLGIERKSLQRIIDRHKLTEFRGRVLPAIALANPEDSDED
jgi:two-component system, response regulator RegA